MSPKSMNCQVTQTMPNWKCETSWIVMLTLLMVITNGCGRSLISCVNMMLSFQTSTRIWTSKKECSKLNAIDAWDEVSLYTFVVVVVVVDFSERLAVVTVVKSAYYYARGHLSDHTPTPGTSGWHHSMVNCSITMHDIARI